MVKHSIVYDFCKDQLKLEQSKKLVTHTAEFDPEIEYLNIIEKQPGKKKVHIFLQKMSDMLIDIND